jgi:predicted transcriptional regulator
MLEKRNNLYVISCTEEEYNEIRLKYGKDIFMPCDAKVAQIISIYKNNLSASAVKMLYVLLTNQDYLLYDWKLVNIAQLSKVVGISAPTAQRAIGDLVIVGAVQRESERKFARMKLFKYSQKILDILAE